MREVYMADLSAGSGRLPEALAQMEVLRAPLVQVLEIESYANLKRHLRWVYFLLKWSDMKWQAGMQEDAGALLDEAIDHLERLLAKDVDRAPYMDELLTARFLYWQQRGEDLFDVPAFSGIEVRFDTEDKSCQVQAGLIRQAILVEDLEKARALTTELLAKGYYAPEFIRTCRKYNLCE
jgi:hypothetical protein